MNGTKTIKIFIHLPKCGGTTIDYRLGKIYGEKFFQYINAGRDKEMFERHWKNGFEDIDIITVHNGSFSYNKYFQGIEKQIYTITRDPVDAFISLFNHQKSEHLKPRFYHDVKNLSLREFLDFSMRPPRKVIYPNFQCRYLCGEPATFKRSKKFIDKYKVIYCNISELENMFVQIVDNFDMSSVSDSGFYANKNVSQNKVLRQDLENRFIDEIYQVFEEDKLLYEYTKTGNLHKKK